MNHQSRYHLAKSHARTIIPRKEMNIVCITKNNVETRFHKLENIYFLKNISMGDQLNENIALFKWTKRLNYEKIK